MLRYLARDKLLYLSMLAFVLISTFGISVKRLSTPRMREVLGKQDYKSSISGSMLPVLIKSENVPVLSAQGVLAIDVDSGVSLYEKNANMELYPASTTKIMTALIALEKYDLDSNIQIKKTNVVGQKMGLLDGEKISVENIINGLLIYSGNDAAEALAEYYPEGRDGFIGAMNDKAKHLDLMHTTFKNPSGLDELGHVSTARDLVRLSQVAMNNKKFSEIVGTNEKIVTSIDGKIVHNLTNINELLKEVPGVKGIKTGWTENARENLVTYIEKDDKKVMVALLGSQDRFGETKELLNWIWQSYEWTDISYSP